MTRSGDVNLTLADRAKVARTNRADLFLSIHFNGFNKSARGVEAFVRTAATNVNTAEDTRFRGTCQDGGSPRSKLGILRQRTGASSR
jgi:N-acetylmuramoyl-L-alanine amidase